MQHTIIIKHIEHILQHLETYLPLANVHMVDYFTCNVFKEYIPKHIQEETESHGYQSTIEAIFNQETQQIPFLHSYIIKNNELTLKNTPLCMSLDQFKTRLLELQGKEVYHQKLDIFMNAKKSHEVEILSGLAAAVHDISNTSHLIDIGDGKGYLSSMLALQYKVPVLGVDASEINTNGAVDRAKKLSRVWNGVVTNIKSRDTSINLYKQITKFIDENVDFPELVSNIFLEKAKGIGLVGLHTCGNLTPSCLTIYNKSDDIKTICNVGCCYHHLTEEFIDNDNEICKDQIGFPLSNYLKQKQYVIGRGARMVAAQSMPRILDKRERPSSTVFYRALFEIIIEQNPKKGEIKNKQVGRFRKGCPNFNDYVQKASKRIDLPLFATEDEVNLLYQNYKHRIHEMDLFYLLRAMLAPVIESLILLDRLLFLIEQGHNDSFLVQFFDPVVSPRCYGIVSIKK